MSYEKQFLLALFITLFSEVPAAFLLAKYWLKKSNVKDILFAGIISSALTLPYFWFVLPSFINNRTSYIWFGETAIVLIEAYIYHHLLKTTAKQALVVSLIANITSIAIGLILSNLGFL